MRTESPGLNFLSENASFLLSYDRNEWERMRIARDSVLSKFGPLFRERSSVLTAKDISDFLDFNQNHHWTGLYRQKGNITSDMPAVRRAVSGLISAVPSGDIARGFDSALSQVKGFGEGILSAILFVSFPEKYAVWNSKTEHALRILELFPPTQRGDTKGDIYAGVSNAVWQAAKYVDQNASNLDDKVDLWTIDYIWHVIKTMHDKGELPYRLHN